MHTEGFSSISSLSLENTALLSYHGWPCPTWQHFCMKPKSVHSGLDSLLSALKSYQLSRRVEDIKSPPPWKPHFGIWDHLQLVRGWERARFHYPILDFRQETYRCTKAGIFCYSWMQYLALLILFGSSRCLPCSDTAHDQYFFRYKCAKISGKIELSFDLFSEYGYKDTLLFLSKRIWLTGHTPWFKWA